MGVEAGWSLRDTPRLAVWHLEGLLVLLVELHSVSYHSFRLLLRIQIDSLHPLIKWRHSDSIIVSS